MSRMDHVVLAMHGVLLASDCSVQTAGLGYVCCAGHVHAIEKALLDACKAMCFCWPVRSSKGIAATSSSHRMASDKTPLPRLPV